MTLRTFTLSVHGQILGQEALDRFFDAFAASRMWEDHQPGLLPGQTLRDSLLDLRDARGVLDLPFSLDTLQDGCDGDPDLVDGLLALGLVVRWSWQGEDPFPDGFDIWDPRDGKGQRFHVGPNATLLVPLERMDGGRTQAHYTRFAALHAASVDTALIVADSAHALLAQRALFPRCLDLPPL